MDELTQKPEETPEKVTSRSWIQERIDMINKVREQDFEPEEFLLDCYNLWLLAVQAHEKKIHLLKINVEPTKEELDALPHWDENSTFDEWLHASYELLVELRIPDVKKRLAEGYSSDHPSPLQLQIMDFAHEIKFDDPAEMEKLDRVYYDFLDWSLHFQKETLENYFAGKVTLGEDMLIKRMIETETGKIGLHEIEKLEALLGVRKKKSTMVTITDRKHSVADPVERLKRQSRIIPHIQ